MIIECTFRENRDQPSLAVQSRLSENHIMQKSYRTKYFVHEIFVIYGNRRTKLHCLLVVAIISVGVPVPFAVTVLTLI